MKKLLFLFAAAAVILSCNRAEKEGSLSGGEAYPQITNVGARTSVSLDGDWNYIVDIYEAGYRDYRRKPMAVENSFFQDHGWYSDKTKLIEYDFDNAPTLAVPGDWNTQKPELYYYEGAVWYRRLFDCEPKPGKRYFLYFGAANYETVAGLNGELLGSHKGGYTPFNFEITGKLKEKNSLVVLVDNTRRYENVPTVNFDWWNYGGITRSVYLLETPETFIRDYSIQLKKGDSSKIAGWVQLDGADASQSVEVSIPELGLNVSFETDAKGCGSFEVEANPQRWSPENPKLYGVTVKCGTDAVEDRIGFRTVETRGTEVLLNGQPVMLKGVSVHEEKPFQAGGRATSIDDYRETLSWAKEMNCNFVRLAHYPHGEEEVRLAEELGLMVWSEIPVYWTIQWNNPETYSCAAQQLSDNITRDRNRANIIIWSVANETPVEAKGRREFLSKLMKLARTLDGTRLVSAAMEKIERPDGTMTVNDPDLVKIADLISFNQYVGWYDGDADKCDRVDWTFDVKKPVFISEFGGGALAGYHGPADVRFTEEYQNYMYEKNIQMLSRIPGFAGCSPWILKDFRSPRRMLPGIQDDYNRKGLVSEYGVKKQAFYTMQDWYEKLD